MSRGLGDVYKRQDLVPCSKLKANQIIRELIDAGYVEMIRSRGRYIVTEKGNIVLEI